MIYDYFCPAHGEFSVERSIKDEPLTECPNLLCKCKVVQLFKSAAVNLNFKDSYNSTRK